MSDDAPKLRLTLDELLDRLNYAVRRDGQAALARQLGVRPQDLCEVLSGRRPPGPKLLSAMRIRKVVTYEPVDE